eukprot:gnl/TRDRNA2_/TRDRNA2_45446_c0_seq1.p1 gnl/TRDRNA2_/TRDRNA2_45446_c0~~gnl/TRDRNA2_/TRDRNA2_45446_c0_seq1.p1  ORF type:complete len:690 (-),score=135.92 gnl/TRDRNA2_/TRDRNA2_45446_c0_seq1:57-1937(-)
MGAGEVVHESRLLAACAFEECIGYVCAGCAKVSAAGSLERCCIQCKQEFYCSEACAQRTSRQHDLICPAMQSWSKLKRVDKQQVAMLRLLLTIYSNLSSKAQDMLPSSGALKPLRELHHEAQASDVNEWSEPLKILRELLRESSAKVFLPDDDGCLIEDLGRLDCNSFSILAEDGSPVGHGIYPTAAVGFNHDCEPNCIVDSASNAGVLRVLAHRDIPAGQELRISYVDSSEPGPLRRRELKLQYGFDCACLRCSKELEGGETSRGEQIGPGRVRKRPKRAGRHAAAEPASEDAACPAALPPAKRRRGGGDTAASSATRAPMLPLQVASAEAGGTNKLLDRLLSDRTINAGIAPSFVHDSLKDSSCLISWAAKLCSLGDAVSDELYYWQGHKARPGEDPRSQFRRQLRQDFAEMASGVAEEFPDAELSADDIRDNSGTKALEELVVGLMDLYESRHAATGKAGKGGPRSQGSRSRGFCLKLEINEKDLCTKFHDMAASTLRFEVALVGTGTVVAQNEQVNWDFWDQTRGELPIPDDIGDDEMTQHIQAWNAKVCPPVGEAATEPLVLLMVKGGGITDRPCIHRAPYTAGMHPRFLISLEKMTLSEMEKQRDMLNLGDAEDDESNSE